MMNVLKPDNSDSVVVLGLGAVGLAAMLAAKSLGASRIVTVDLADAKLELASRLGAGFTVNTGSEDLVSRLHKILPLGANKILDTARSAALLQPSIQCIAHGETFALVGVPSPQVELNINALDLLLSCKHVIGVVEGSSDPRQVSLPRANWSDEQF